MSIKSWWSDDQQWFCLLVDDGCNKATVSLTREEAASLSMAADKVRAEGFDAEAAGEKLAAYIEAWWTSEDDDSAIPAERATAELNRAFAAGLTKGEAALEAVTCTLEDEQVSHQKTLKLLAKGEAALEQIEAWPNHTRDDLADTVQRMQTIAKNALALVRKGV